MNVIFLDFDGVMVTASHDFYLVSRGLPESDDKGRPVFDPRCVENLRQIISATGADVVVTSDWKYLDSYGDMLAMWRQRGMPGFMTDTTPNVSKHRGTEIERWLDECKVDCNYVIIDDLGPENFNESQHDRLVVVDPFCGLDDNAAQKAISILNRQAQ